MLGLARPVVRALRCSALPMRASASVCHQLPIKLGCQRPELIRCLSGVPSSPAHELSPEAAVVNLDEGRRLLTITWPSTGSEVLPLAWLRDSCQCPQCFNSVTRSRTLHFKDFDPKMPVKSAAVSPKSGLLTVEWQDGHISSYTRQWLHLHSFTESARDNRETRLVKLTREKSWSQEQAEFDYSELMKDDSVLLKLLRCLDKFGCLLVRHAPPTLDVVPDFGRRLAGYLSACNYGHTFEVKSKKDPSNAAYTSGYLGLHTDQCFFERKPGVQILHCISQPHDGSIQGGESLLSDGFLAASLLRRSRPDLFEALTSLPIDFNDYGSDFVGDFHLLNREPVLRLNKAGEVDRITFSSHSRDYYQNHLPPEKVQLLYDALKLFYDLLSKPPCCIQHKLMTGDIQVVDNRRVLHGRQAFRVVGSAERFLHGGYVEWDEIYSRIRRLDEAKSG